MGVEFIPVVTAAILTAPLIRATDYLTSFYVCLIDNPSLTDILAAKST